MRDEDGQGESISWLVRSAIRSAGRQLREAKSAYGNAKRAARADVPQDETGKARIVCRRYAERRAVELDDAARPDCFDPDHPDCQGCVEDIRDGTVETW